MRQVIPLTFREVADFRDDYSQDMIREYMLYGGLPQVVLENDINKKVSYLEQQIGLCDGNRRKTRSRTDLTM